LKTGFWPTPDVRGFSNMGSMQMLADLVDSWEEFNGMTYRAGITKTAKVWQEKLMNEQSTLFAEDTPASHSHMPGSEAVRTMTAISGQKCIDLLKLSDRDGCLPRMLLGTSRWASTMCYLTWKPRTTPGGRLLFQLVPSMPSTAEIESGLWPTPAARDYRSPHAHESESFLMLPRFQRIRISATYARRIW